MDRFSKPGQGRRYFLLQTRPDRLWGPLRFYSNEIRLLYLGKDGRRMTLTIHFNLELRLWLSGTTSVLHLCASMAGIENLVFYHFLSFDGISVKMPCIRITYILKENSTTCRAHLTQLGLTFVVIFSVSFKFLITDLLWVHKCSLELCSRKSSTHDVLQCGWSNFTPLWKIWKLTVLYFGVSITRQEGGRQNIKKQIFAMEKKNNAYFLDLKWNTNGNREI